MISVGEARERVKKLEKRLDQRQKKFCDLLLVGKSGTEAATEAGYSAKSAASRASKLRATEYIQDYLTARTDLEAAKLGITEGWILSKTVQIVERCMEAEPVLEWDETLREKVPKGRYVFDATGALRGLKQIGEIIGVGTETQVAVGGLEEYLRKLEEKR